MVDNNSAWRSRCTTCVAILTGSRPNFSHTYCSTNGSILEYVPTAPDNLPTATLLRACSMRSISRSTSAIHNANFKPNVVGSPWMPWVRPIIGVYLNSAARRRNTSCKRFKSSIKISQACFIMYPSAVSFTSVEVRPRWMYLAASGPTYSPTAVTKEMISWFVSFSIS